MKKLDIYIASGIVLLASLYLHSPVTALGGIALWVIALAEEVFVKAAKDAEITELIRRMDKLDKEHKTLSQDVINVHERAKVILGEQF